MTSSSPKASHVAIELNPLEVELILLLRGIRFGEVTIMLRDGVPYDILEIVKRRRLGAVDNSPA